MVGIVKRLAVKHKAICKNKNITVKYLYKEGRGRLFETWKCLLQDSLNADRVIPSQSSCGWIIFCLNHKRFLSSIRCQWIKLCKINRPQCLWRERALRLNLPSYREQYMNMFMPRKAGGMATCQRYNTSNRSRIRRITCKLMNWENSQRKFNQSTVNQWCRRGN